MEEENISVAAAARESALLPLRYPGAFLRASLIFVLLSVVVAVDMGQLEPWLILHGKFEGGIANFSWNFHLLSLIAVPVQISMMMGFICLGYFGVAGIGMVGWLNLNGRTWRLTAQGFKIGLVLLIILVVVLMIQKVILYVAQLIAIPFFGFAILAIALIVPFYWMALQLGFSVVAAVADNKSFGMFDAWVTKDRVSVHAALVLWISVSVFDVLEYGLMWSTTMQDPTYLLRSLSLGAIQPVPMLLVPPPIWVAVTVNLLSFVEVAWITIFCTVVYRRLRTTQADALVEEF